MTVSTFSFIIAAAKGDSQGGGLISLLILVLPMAALVYVMTIPQRKQRQKQADMLRKVEVGDEVVTSGGIVGVITHVEDELFHVEVDHDVVVRVAKNAITRNLSAVEDTSPTKSRKGLLDGALGSGSTKDSGAEDPTESRSKKNSGKDTDA